MKDYREYTHPTRIKILKALSTEPKGVTEISKELQISRPEISRHLGTLRSLNLVTREESINYLSDFGNLILSILAPLDFILEFENYFMEHPLINFPTSFLYGLKELQGCELIQGSGFLFQKQIELGPITSDRLKLMVNSPIPNVSGVQFADGQLIVRQNANMKVLSHENLSKDLKRYEIRQYSEINYIIFIIGDKYGFFHFPTKDGIPDVNSCLFVNNERGIKYLLALWDYYWNNSTPLTKFPK